MALPVTSLCACASFLFSQSGAAQILTDAQIAQVVDQLRGPVSEWIRNIKLRGQDIWKQSFKINFVLLTQFSDPGRRRKLWKEDLNTAATLTAARICPNWQSDFTEKTTYNCIQGLKIKKMNKSPRQDWLQEKAYLWLKSLHLNTPKPVWYPHHAIEVAHKVFLSDAGKFPTWMKYLSLPGRRRQEPIDHLINAHKPAIATPINNNLSPGP